MTQANFTRVKVESYNDKLFVRIQQEDPGDLHGMWYITNKGLIPRVGDVVDVNLVVGGGNCEVVKIHNT